MTHQLDPAALAAGASWLHGWKWTGNFTALDLIAAGTNALNGALLARRPDHHKNFTIAGVLLMALLMGHHPPRWECDRASPGARAGKLRQTCARCIPCGTVPVLGSLMNRCVKSVPAAGPVEMCALASGEFGTAALARGAT